MNPPDRQEKSIRFGCAFVFGFVTTALGGVGFLYLQGHDALVIALLVGLVFGLYAMRHGDRFWEWILSRWWWPL
jgi:uncharacterized membrane protein (DUF441 family)